MQDLQKRSIRTLAWLGDACFELEVRRRLAARGDFSTSRLDAMKAEIVRADAQARLFEAIEPALLDEERDVAARAKNASPPASARGRRSTRAYRAATAFEALFAWWELAGDSGRARLHAVVGPSLDAAIDSAITRKATRLRRG